MRRTLPAQLAGEVGALDPAAIEEVQRESWPVVRDPDELHDALLTLLWLPVEEVQDWAVHLPRLIEEGRAVELNVRGEAQEVRGWVATEHRAQMESMFASGDEAATDATVLGWMESIGPTTTMELATRLHFPAQSIDQSFIRLEASGQVLRGRFRPNSALGTQHSELSGDCWRAFIV